MSKYFDAAILHKLLRYEPETGKLYWLARDVTMFSGTNERYTAAIAAASWNNQYAGKEAFTASNANGYRVGALWNKTYLAHRVIWALNTGSWPANKLDHIDRDPANNRMSNLRECLQSQNTLNRPGNKTGKKTSKYKGVYWQKDISRWCARFREEYLGTFKDEDEAAAAYDAAALAFDRKFAYLNSVDGGGLSLGL